ncbi:MAG: hypothetical protein H6672_17965 [Anaerolineaceae bacterium]|nr:hypothetical protein [Anaerolineaceae bacterium]
MDRKQMCIANVKYKKPSTDGAKQSKNLLKYLTYRESRDEKARQAGGSERWLDHGMGRSVAEIAERSAAYRSEHVLLFSLVINPAPDLIGMVAPEDREWFVRQLTERTVNAFFDARGIDTGVEWSAVLHHRQTDGEETPGQPNPHAHVVLPGTYYDADEGRRQPLYFSQRRDANHIEMLHAVTQDSMVALLDRYVGPDWEQRMDMLLAVREQQAGIVSAEEAHAVWGETPVWAGVRRTDEATSAVGIYGFFPNREGQTVLQFRPALTDLDHDEAERMAVEFKAHIRDDHDIETDAGWRPTLDL